jgi:DNA-binding response OmpR family regulator
MIDDDKFLLDLYSMKFKNAGHDVSTFSGGEEVLKELRKGDEAPDAILLDVIMPSMDGLTLLATIRKEKLAPTSKIIMLSNQGSESDIEKAKELGAHGYIVKASAIPSEVLAQTVAMLEKSS